MGCGHDPSGVQAVTSKLKQFERIKSFTWQPLVPVAQLRSRTKHYVEYVLIGIGPECPFHGATPSFLQARRGYPSIRLRPKRCEQPIPGINAGIGEEHAGCCAIHTWARRYMVHLPNPPRAFKKEQRPQEDEFMELAGDDNAAEDESSDSEGSIDSIDPSGMGSDVEAAEENTAVPASAKVGKEWHDAWRWGWAMETWSTFLQQLNPPLAVLCNSFHAQPGFLMAVLSYNEERYGLDRCNLIAFYPRNGAVKEEGVRSKFKALEQAHMADHVLAQVSSVVADFRLAASKAVRKRHLFRTASTEGQPSTKAAKVEGSTNTVGAADGAGTAGISAAAPSQASTGADAVSDVKAKLFISVFGNSGPKAQLIPLPADKCAEDSDAETCGGDAGDMSHAVVSKRNMATMKKHNLKIMKSSGPEGAGNGLHASRDMPAGTTLPVKGIWFNDLEKLNAWLRQQHPLTAQTMSRKIVEVHFTAPPEGSKVTRYFVMTGLAGYVNTYTGILQRPNAQLVFNPDRPLGQYSLQVRLVADLAADREILIAYGSQHLLKEKKRPGPKLKKKKAGEA